MVCKQFLMIASAAIALLLPAMPSVAYEEDTHFLITYVICRSVGFTDQEALTVATADQGMDDSAGTDPVGITAFYATNQWQWHALDLGGGMGSSGILKQKDLMFQVAQDRWITPQFQLQERLTWLGVFFHYQQDTWAHRHHYTGTIYSYAPPTNFAEYTTYNTPLGHAKDIHQPDRPPFDPVAALMNLEDGIVYARTFLKNVMRRNPTAFLASYSPMGGKEDANWTGKGRFLHQLASDGAPSSARRYLTDLIRAQVDAYSNGYDGYFAGYTSNEADYSKVSGALRQVYNSYASQLGGAIVVLPDKVTKWNHKFSNGQNGKGFTRAYLQGMMGGWQDVLGFEVPRSTSLLGITGAWTAVRGSGPPNAPQVAGMRIISAIVMPDGWILGVGTDGGVWRKQPLNTGNQSWSQANATPLQPNEIKVVALTRMPDGMLLGVGTDHLLYTTRYATPPQLMSLWQKVPNSGSVMAVTMMPDGKILGVGTENNLHIKATLAAPWQLVPNSGSIIAVTVMPDGTILGVSKNFQGRPGFHGGDLLFRRTLTAPWKRAPNCNAAIEYHVNGSGQLVDDNYIPINSVAMMPDGRVLGVSWYEPDQLFIKGPGDAWLTKR